MDDHNQADDHKSTAVIKLSNEIEKLRKMLDEARGQTDEKFYNAIDLFQKSIDTFATALDTPKLIDHGIVSDEPTVLGKFPGEVWDIILEEAFCLQAWATTEVPDATAEEFWIAGMGQRPASSAWLSGNQKWIKERGLWSTAKNGKVLIDPGDFKGLYLVNTTFKGMIDHYRRLYETAIVFTAIPRSVPFKKEVLERSNARRTAMWRHSVDVDSASMMLTYPARALQKGLTCQHCSSLVFSVLYGLQEFKVNPTFDGVLSRKPQTVLLDIVSPTWGRFCIDLNSSWGFYDANQLHDVGKTLAFIARHAEELSLKNVVLIGGMKCDTPRCEDAILKAAFWEVIRGAYENFTKALLPRTLIGFVDVGSIPGVARSRELKPVAMESNQEAKTGLLELCEIVYWCSHEWIGLLKQDDQFDRKLSSNDIDGSYDGPVWSDDSDEEDKEEDYPKRPDSSNEED